MNYIKLGQPFTINSLSHDSMSDDLFIIVNCGYRQFCIVSAVDYMRWSDHTIEWDGNPRKIPYTTLQEHLNAQGYYPTLCALT